MSQQPCDSLNLQSTDIWFSGQDNTNHAILELQVKKSWCALFGMSSIY